MDCRPYADRLTGDGVCCVAGPGIGRITLRDQLNAVGIRNTAVDQEHRRESGQFLINEEFIATLDYLVAASLWASIVFSRALATYYRQRVSYYKYHNGKEGSRNWKDKLYECLHAWQNSLAIAFPTGYLEQEKHSRGHGSVGGCLGCGGVPCRLGIKAGTCEGTGPQHRAGQMVGSLCSCAGGTHPWAGRPHRPE